MALELGTTNVEFTRDGKFMLFDDTTVYGGANPARNAVAIFWYGVYKALSGDIPIKFEPYLFASATRFYPHIYQDGHHLLTMLAFASATMPLEADYIEGNVVYDTATSTLQQLQDGIWIPLDTDSIADVADKAIAKKDINVFPVVNNSIALLDEIHLSLDDLFTINMDDHCAKSGTQINSKEYDLLYLRLETILGEVCAGNWKIAQRNIEFLNQKLA